MEVYILLTRDNNDTKRNILGIWTDPRVTSEERLVEKEFIAYTDIETWGEKGITAFSI